MMGDLFRGRAVGVIIDRETGEYTEVYDPLIGNPTRVVGSAIVAFMVVLAVVLVIALV